MAPSCCLSPPGTREGAAKPSPVATRPPRVRDQERKKASFTSSLRMELHSRAARSRKSTKFRSLSRSLILCHSKASDDGSSPDERHLDPFEMSLGQGKEGVVHSPMQLADTSEVGPSLIPTLGLLSGAAALQAAGSDGGKLCRRMFFLKVGRGLLGWGVPLASGEACPSPPALPHHRTRAQTVTLTHRQGGFEAGPPAVGTVVSPAQWVFPDSVRFCVHPKSAEPGSLLECAQCRQAGWPQLAWPRQGPG